MLQSFLNHKAINHSLNYISGYDTALNITLWNKACEQKFGISSHDAIGKSLLFHFPHITNDYRVACMRKAIAAGDSFFFPALPYLYAEGFYHQLIFPLHNEVGIITGIINVIQDCENTGVKVSKNDLMQSVLYSLDIH